MRQQAFVAGVALAALWGVPALAAPASPDVVGQTTQVPEVVVTATKTGETKLQKTPMAITAFTAETLALSGASDLRDLAAMTPNLAITANTGFAEIYIRGIGSNNVFAGSDPDVTVYLDGVYLARPTSDFNDFLDVDRIEVLRGPQGTLYGRNSVGGTINVISRKPDDQFRAKAQFTIGDYSLFREEGYVSGPIVPGLVAGSFSIMDSRRDGYQRNIAPGGNKAVDSENYWATRGQLRFTPTPRFDATLRADYSRSDAVPGGYLKPLVASPDPLANTILGNYHLVALDTPMSTIDTERGVALDASYKINDALTLTSLTAYRKADFSLNLDSDATSLHTRETDWTQNQNQFSEELNLLGTFGRLRFVGGLYYFSENIASNLRVESFAASLQINPNARVHTRALAAFAEGTYAFTDKLSATVGLRYTDEDKKFTQFYNIRHFPSLVPLPGYPILTNSEGKYDAPTPKFELDYKPTDTVMVYASVTRGFKSGGFNITDAHPGIGFKPEYLWSYEAGIKSDLLDRRLRLDGSAFYYDYSNLQVLSFITPGVGDITNAATATVKGVEVEAVAKPTRGLELGGSVSYLDARYKSYPVAPVGLLSVNASGNYLNSASAWSFDVYSQYTVQIGAGQSLFARGEYSYKSRQFFTPDNNAISTQEAYGLIDASIGYRSAGGHWQVMVFGRNLADTQYVTSTASFTGPISGYVGAPRTFGVRLIVEN